ncbi:MAG: TetR/AcrR family transcriptional regulator [Halioglobus sp.]
MIIVHSNGKVNTVFGDMSRNQVHAGQAQESGEASPMAERILDATQLCIERFGIRRTSLEEVARVGKLSRGSIYKHFKDKDSLVQGLFHRHQELYLNRIEALLLKETTLVDKLALSVVAGRKDRQESVFASLAEIEPETVAMMYLNPAFYSRSIAFWPPHVRMAQKTGEISADLDVDLVTDIAMRLVVSLVLFPSMGVNLKSSKAIQSYLRQALYAGIQQKSEEYCNTHAQAACPQNLWITGWINCSGKPQM